MVVDVASDNRKALQREEIFDKLWGQDKPGKQIPGTNVRRDELHHRLGVVDTPEPISLRHHKGFGPVRYVDQHANRVAQVLHDVTHDGYIEACHARVELAHMRFDQAGARIEGLVREPDPLRSASRRGRRVWRMSAPSAPDRGNKS